MRVQYLYADITLDGNRSANNANWNESSLHECSCARNGDDYSRTFSKKFIFGQGLSHERISFTHMNSAIVRCIMSFLKMHKITYNCCTCTAITNFDEHLFLSSNVIGWFKALENDVLEIPLRNILKFNSNTKHLHLEICTVRWSFSGWISHDLRLSRYPIQRPFHWRKFTRGQSTQFPSNKTIQEDDYSY